VSGNVAFLLIAVGIAVVGSMIVWLRYRKPKTFMSSINDFAREMDALGREPGTPESKRFTSRNPRSRAVPIVPAPEQGDLARRLKEARDLRANERDLGER
jgi:hypothetical protein